MSLQVGRTHSSGQYTSQASPYYSGGYHARAAPRTTLDPSYPQVNYGQVPIQMPHYSQAGYGGPGQMPPYPPSYGQRLPGQMSPYGPNYGQGVPTQMQVYQPTYSQTMGSNPTGMGGYSYTMGGAPFSRAAYYGEAGYEGEPEAGSSSDPKETKKKGGKKRH